MGRRAAGDGFAKFGGLRPGCFVCQKSDDALNLGNSIQYEK